MATVDKNFRIKNGLAVEGNVATVNGENILREGSGDSYIINLIGGTATSENTANTVVKRDGFGNFAAGQIDLSAKLYTPEVQFQNAGAIFEDSGLNIQSYANNDISIYASKDVNITSQSADVVINPDGNAFLWSKINENQIATHGYADNAASNAQSAAITSANGYTDTIAGQLATSIQQAVSDANSYTNDEIAIEVTNRNNAITNAINSESDARNNAISDAIAIEVTDRNNAIATAKQEAIDHADGLINDASNASNEVWSAYKTSTEISLAEGRANTYTDGKVADLVDSAPALLDTLNELAAAIADNPNYASDVANLVATKADTTYVDSQDANTLSSAQTYAAGQAQDAYDNAVATAATDATNKAATAETNANTYTDNSISNGNASATPTYQGVRLGYYTELISGWDAVGNGAAFVPVSWNANYGTAKLTVHVRDGIHSQASEILIARDSSYNLAITEYAIVTTNGIIADISARVLNGQVELLVTPTNGHTSVESVATGSVIVWAD